MKQLLALLVVMVLATGSILAQSNESYIDQFGNSNGAGVVQTGLLNWSTVYQNNNPSPFIGNSALLLQQGTKLTSATNQMGDGNDADVWQKGTGAGELAGAPPLHVFDPNNWPPGGAAFYGAFVDQIGENNKAKIYQEGGTGGDNQNVAGVIQHGNGNTYGPLDRQDPWWNFPTTYPTPEISIYQKGYDLWGWMNITGHRNVSSIRQTGLGNATGHTLFGEMWVQGDDNQLVIWQEGTDLWAMQSSVNGDNNHVYIEQHGFGGPNTGAEIDVFGNDNTGCISQFGNGNWAWELINGDRNHLKVKQDGDYNIDGFWGTGYTTEPLWNTINGNDNISITDVDGNSNRTAYHINGNWNENHITVLGDANKAYE